MTPEKKRTERIPTLQWTNITTGQLITLKREPTNVFDGDAVAGFVEIDADTVMVGHLPRELAKVMRDVNLEN